MKFKDKKSFWFLLVIVNIFIMGILLWVIYGNAGYSLNQTKKTHLIGASYMTMNNEFYKIVSEEISARAEAEGDRLVLRDPALDAGRQIEQIREMLGLGIDVLVVTPVDWESLESVLEISKGSKKKYELDKETGLIILDRVLYTSTHYPMNYGFIPRTLGDDGDPLDVLIMCSEPLEPLTLVRCYPIGVLKMTDGGAGDEKIIAIPWADPTYQMFTELSELPKHIFDEIHHFFSVYKDLEGKKTAVNEFSGALDAVAVIEECMERYKSKFVNKV